MCGCTSEKVQEVEYKGYEKEIKMDRRSIGAGNKTECTFLDYLEHDLR